MKIIPGLSKILLKNWNKIGEIEGYPILLHIEKGTKAVFVSEKELKPLEQFEKILKNKKILDAKLRKEKLDRLKKIRKITDFIQTDAKSRNLGLLDFSPRNWFSYARGYKTPKENILYYEESFLPLIRDSYNKLVNDGKLYFDPKTKTVMGLIGEKFVPLSNTEDKMAYIVTNTPNANYLHFDGDVYATGVPSEYVSSFIKNGGPHASGRPNWGSSNLGSQSYYRGPRGISGIFTSIKPKLIKKFLNVGKYSKIPDEPILYTPVGINPTSKKFIGNNSINTVIGHEPFGYQVTTRPIIDDVASEGGDVLTKMQIIGTELPLKAILGNSGRYSMKDKNPFNTIISPLLITGGLTAGGLGYAARNNKESN